MNAGGKGETRVVESEVLEQICEIYLQGTDRSDNLTTSSRSARWRLNIRGALITAMICLVDSVKRICMLCAMKAAWVMVNGMCRHGNACVSVGSDASECSLGQFIESSPVVL